MAGVEGLEPSNTRVRVWCLNHLAIPQYYYNVWLGWLDSNQRILKSKSSALPLGDTPLIKISGVSKGSRTLDL